MSFSEDSGYTANTIETIMLLFMNEINTQFGTEYTAESFVGTNHYKYFYAIAQLYQLNEVKTSEIFLKLLQYINLMNEKIARPVVTNPGMIEKFLAEGYVASVKPMIEADAGKIHIAIDLDDGERATGNVTITNYANLVSGTDDSVTIGATVFTAQTGAATPGAGTFQAATSNALTAQSLAAQINAHTTAGALVRATPDGDIVRLKARTGGVGGNAIALVYTDNDTNVGATVSGSTLTGGEDNPDYDDLKLEIATLISQITVAGAVTIGTQSQAVVLSNGQSFDFKYNLPNRIEVLLKLTITLSENNEFLIADPSVTKLALLANIDDRYQLGKNFEPQRYFSLLDAPWASQVVLEWSIDGGVTYSNAVYNSEYDVLFDVKLENIQLIEV